VPITAGVLAIAGLSSLGLASVGIGLAVGVLTVASKTQSTIQPPLAQAMGP
jgi:hypothetical protein